MGGELRDTDGRDSHEGRRLTEAELPSYFWEQFPIFLSYGMTADEYWNGDNRLPRAFLKAQKLKEQRENNYEHRMGAYIYHALCEVSPLFRFSTKRVKAEAYLDKPFALTKEEQEQREYDEKMKRKQNFFRNLMASGKKEVDNNG